MSEEFDNVFDPSDIDRIKSELVKGTIQLPCNIWGIIKEILERLDNLEKTVNKAI